MLVRLDLDDNALYMPTNSKEEYSALNPHQLVGLTRHTEKLIYVRIVPDFITQLWSKKDGYSSRNKFAFLYIDINYHCKILVLFLKQVQLSKTVVVYIVIQALYTYTNITTPCALIASD